MKKFKMLVMAVVTISAYAEEDMNMWIYNNYVTRSVYGHMRGKEKRCRDLSALDRRAALLREKTVCC